MRIHHFYPQSQNVGDHFVALGVQRLFREIAPAATFASFPVNGRGDGAGEFGITLHAVERANREADLVVVGGSNLYEPYPGQDRWGVHLDPHALPRLRVPLLLVGIGTGSDPGARKPTPPTRRVAEEIRLLNRHACFSGARDVVTLHWLQGLGVGNARLLGDPATFLFSSPARAPKPVRRIAVVLPPRRLYWQRWGRIRFWDMRGPNLWRAMMALPSHLAALGLEGVVLCNDSRDASLARHLRAPCGAFPIEAPPTPDAYLGILRAMDAVVTARLHTAVVAFSLGIPFVLVDFDQRTHGFVRTYGLHGWVIPYVWMGMAKRLRRQVRRLLAQEVDWRPLVAKRDEMRNRALAMLREAVASPPAPSPSRVRTR
ncbi:MAG: polysaccharide pyruvyl transferase family protein [Armatimonadota bacterium]|nr:polysaccharide pyruvyl transferase family protein [Armatimonadota bacterium]MDR7443540.1 polysaccharide pyruvyl transferase family protein [Armatimonadota bacterium]MDR7570373.1 polysaccharide pyruvyl transferase family protein [Armatimonadota bacterium]MDR7615039.1 polysaccharide pyruvyl transferase family protein [Armatimonadota bacterium]